MHCLNNTNLYLYTSLYSLYSKFESNMNAFTFIVFEHMKNTTLNKNDLMYIKVKVKWSCCVVQHKLIHLSDASVKNNIHMQNKLIV